MIFHGLVKSTLLDYPNKLACTLFTGGCNFRCPFCQNSSLVLDPSSEPIIDPTELDVFLKKRVKYLDGVCITGGEPLLQKNVDDYCKYLKDLGYLVKIDTNGSFPKKLESLISKNLVDYIAMDLKSSKEGYSKAVGIDNFNISQIEESVEIIKNCNLDHEFRTTLVKELHGEKEIIGIGKWLDKSQKLYLQRFEDKGSNIVKNLHGFNENETKVIQNILKSYIDLVIIRGY
ncbi:MAG: anaerobic ribonucleoside-triphosphate reductase activating protein [Spirochaetia bacterium]|nr:anaerobic ribonucleoside-triphosphate reductase activating protein [Spirochaetia bacterium]